MLEGTLRQVDWQLGSFMQRFAPGLSPAAQSVVANLAYAMSVQHSCMDTRDIAPEALQELRTAGLLGDGDRVTPLVQREDLLYFHRYFEYEQAVAAALAARNRVLASTPPDVSGHFPEDADPHQRAAAIAALTRQLVIITGGPGTGKTSTVVKILALLLSAEPDLVVRLAAPTGKAAMRLASAIKGSLAGLPEPMRTAIPTEVKTLHRLLGIRDNGRRARYNAERHLPVDLLIVDEVSMVDLLMMQRLLGALPPNARLILLGDPGQLPSVDTGNVLADICHAQDSLISDARCHFERSFRFAGDRGIGRLARQILSGDAGMTDSEDGEVRFEPAPAWRTQARLLDFFKAYLDALDGDHDTLLQTFDNARILCAVRDGDNGVSAVNEAVEQALEARGLKAPGQRFYHGRPVMVSRNDYTLGLFNGDVGICVKIGDRIFVVFSDPGGGTRTLLASRLPEHETCFAMTVHKSQGSEFTRVALLLSRPGTDRGEQLLGRELLYTAVTRAREAIVIYSDEDTWQSSLSRSAARMSGLHRFLVTRP